MRLILILSLILFSTQTFAKKLNFIAFGDAPYYMPEAGTMFDKLQLQIDKERVSFAVHVGDIRGGGESTCTNKVLLNVKNKFDKFKTPLVYTPGDNEWTDCHRYKQDPIERLNFLRENFFATKQSFGKRTIALDRQADITKFSKFVENSKWQRSDIQFGTIHIVGSKNNYLPENELAMQEYKNRYKANLDWMERIFKKGEKSKAIVLFIHANPLFEAEDDHNKALKQCASSLLVDCIKACGAMSNREIYKGCEASCRSEVSAEKNTKACYKPVPENGFLTFNKKLTELVKKFNRPVLLVHGDFHKFSFDRPLKVATKFPGVKNSLPNFFRLQVYGAPEIGAVKITVDSSKAQPFSVSPLLTIPWEYKAD